MPKFSVADIRSKRRKRRIGWGIAFVVLIVGMSIYITQQGIWESIGIAIYVSSLVIAVLLPSPSSNYELMIYFLSESLKNVKNRSINEARESFSKFILHAEKVDAQLSLPITNNSMKEFNQWIMNLRTRIYPVLKGEDATKYMNVENVLEGFQEYVITGDSKKAKEIEGQLLILPLDREVRLPFEEPSILERLKGNIIAQYRSNVAVRSIFNALLLIVPYALVLKVSESKPSDPIIAALLIIAATLAVAQTKKE